MNEWGIVCILHKRVLLMSGSAVMGVQHPACRPPIFFFFLQFEEECTETFAFILPPTSTHVLNMPGDNSCDEDFPFEIPFQFWRAVSSKFRGKNNKNKCTEIITSSYKQDSCHNKKQQRHTEWTWHEQQQNAFEALKKHMSCPPVLSYYDVSRPVTLTCDASQYGLGVACLQGKKPVAYASCTITDTETRYAQIEKELLAEFFHVQNAMDASTESKLPLKQTTNLSSPHWKSLSMQHQRDCNGWC